MLEIRCGVCSHVLKVDQAFSLVFRKRFGTTGSGLVTSAEVRPFLSSMRCSQCPAAQPKGPVYLQNRTPPSKPKTPTKTDSTWSRKRHKYTGAPHLGGPLGSREKPNREKGDVYLGSGRKGKFDNCVYHRESCGWAARLNTNELVVFSSVKAARFRGYNPCKRCKPPQK